MEQRMGPVPDHRIGPCVPDFNKKEKKIVLDLFEPKENSEQGANRKGMGSHVYLHGYLSSTCGVYGKVLNGQFPHGHAKIYVHKRYINENPI